MLNEITPLILTYNEAPNIARTLASVSWAKEIVVVDSFSSDNTLKIARSFPQVRTFQRAFDCHQNQWEFGLKETGITTPGNRFDIGSVRKRVTVSWKRGNFAEQITRS